MIPLDLHPYLRSSSIIDSDHPAVVAQAHALASGHTEPAMIAKATSL